MLVCPEAVDGLAIAYHGKERSAIASRALTVGEVVTRCSPMIWGLRSQYLTNRCSGCFVSESTIGKALLRCSKCKVVCYCSAACQRLDFFQHAACCSQYAAIQRLDKAVADDVSLILKMVHIKKKAKAVYCSCADGVISCGINHFDVMAVGGGAFDDSMVQTISQALDLLKTNHFEQITDILTRFRSNNFGLFDSMMNCVGMGVFPRAAILNHSCDPNCLIRYNYNNQQVPVLEIVAIRPIAAGEELFHCYVDATQPAAMRRKQLFDIYGFHCSCSVCNLSSKGVNEIPTDVKLHLRSLQAPETIADELRLTIATFGVAAVKHFTDSLLLEVTNEAAYPQVCQKAAKLLSPAQEASLVHSNEKAATQLLSKAVELIEEVVGPFNFERYKLRCQLLTQLLLTGDLERAKDSCLYIVSYLCLCLCNFPFHPLIGLQLYTLGDIYSSLGEESTASRYHGWAREVLLVTHGDNSPLTRSLI